jgi:bifunctional DNA-binding transcriptional regulator/antitoxin component of YhaV-PrlF toxin-antitoxin module
MDMKQLEKEKITKVIDGYRITIPIRLRKNIEIGDFVIVDIKKVNLVIE